MVSDSHSSDEALTRILSWWSGKTCEGIDFCQTLITEHDKYDDYKVKYELRFEPKDLDKIRVEIWITDEGAIGIGLETFARLGRRLNSVSCRRGFVDGHEPRFTSIEDILLFLDNVAENKISIRYARFFNFVLSAQVIFSEKKITAIAKSRQSRFWPKLSDLSLLPALTYRSWR